MSDRATVRFWRLHACVVAAAVVASGCSADRPGADHPSAEAAGSTSSPATASGVGATAPSGEWSATLDSRPTVAVVGPDGVYVTSAGASRFAPQVYRLALDDGRELARRTAVGQPNGAALAPDGTLWVAAERHIDQPAGTGINVQDPVSLLVVDQIELPDTPLSIAAVATTMWVGSRGQIFVVDPTTRSVARSIAIGGPAYQVLPTDDGTSVVVVEGDAIEVVSVDGTVATRTSLVSSGSIAAALDGSTVWARVPVDVDSELNSFQLPGLAEASSGPVLDSTSGGLLVAGGTVWAVDDRADELACIAPDGTAASLPASGAVGVLAALADDRILLATQSGVQLRTVGCISY